jgi:hypothetical protein
MDFMENILFFEENRACLKILRQRNSLTSEDAAPTAAILSADDNIA